MTGYRVFDMAEAQAIGLCWLARQQGPGGRPGLPQIHTLRVAVTQMHAEDCDWCAYPADELMRMLQTRDVSERSEEVWWNMPARARGRAIELAQGRE